MSIATIIQTRTTTLINTFVYDVFPPLVEVDDVNALAGLTTVLDEFTTTGLGAGGLNRRSTNNVVMLAAAGGSADKASVWVRADYSDYRAAYAAFVRKMYNITVTTADLAAYDVDHLLNRARAGNGNTLLRIEASPLGINRQWGSVLEKLATQSNVAGNRRTKRLMSCLIAAKVAGFAPPTTLQDPVSRARLARELASLGIPLKEAQDGLDTLLGHIARNLR